MTSMPECGVMAKHRGRPKRSERDDVTVKVDRAVVGMAKAVATSRGIPLAELLSELLEGPVGRAYATMLRDLEKRKDRE